MFKASRSRAVTCTFEEVAAGRRIFQALVKTKSPHQQVAHCGFLRNFRHYAFV